ncbi:hypothetical protein AVEN_215156-1 [Araneus ventricosus]|uniref:Tc1-like transposase DDE domain-containing protein n=1 Tax=Araneus ventricosus TaxID=182803 RepID=A0A4Y2SGW9_ARAVE|nr:hypothetical protein AVEN_215156-1 [Araneus ventricosus]
MDPKASRDLTSLRPGISHYSRLPVQRRAMQLVGLLFFEEKSPAGPVTCTVNGVSYESLLHSHVNPAFQQRACADRTIFMPDCPSPHIANPVKLLTFIHFGNDRIISRYFPTNWLPSSPDLNPCDFWLWGYLKHVVFGDTIANLAELKASIAQHIHKIITDTLRSVVEHDISWFELVAQNDGQQIVEHFLNKSRES